LSQCSVCFAQCCLCLLIIISWLGIRFSHIVLSVLPSVACVSGLSFLDWPFGFHTMFCLLCPVLPLSLPYQFLIGPFVFTQYSLSCGLSCPCPWIIISWLVLRFSHNGLCLVALVASVPGLSILDWPFGFHTMFCLLCPVFPVSLGYQLLISVACVSWLSVIDWSFGFHTMFCLLCPVLPVSLGYQFLIGPSVFTQWSLSCCLSCMCLWIIISWLTLRFSHNVLSVVIVSIGCQFLIDTWNFRSRKSKSRQ
jgi:hypothetical protein